MRFPEEIEMGGVAARATRDTRERRKAGLAIEMVGRPAQAPTPPDSPLLPLGTAAGDYAQLTYVDLSRSQPAIEYIARTGRLPRWLARCTSLRYLVATHMDIAVVEDWVSEALPALRVVRLGFNRIQTWPDHMVRLKDLEVLDLEGNPCVDNQGIKSESFKSFYASLGAANWNASLQAGATLTGFGTDLAGAVKKLSSRATGSSSSASSSSGTKASSMRSKKAASTAGTASSGSSGGGGGRRHKLFKNLNKHKDELAKSSNSNSNNNNGFAAYSGPSAMGGSGMVMGGPMGIGFGFTAGAANPRAMASPSRATSTVPSAPSTTNMSDDEDDTDSDADGDMLTPLEPSTHLPTMLLRPSPVQSPALYSPSPSPADVGTPRTSLVSSGSFGSAAGMPALTTTPGATPSPGASPVLVDSKHPDPFGLINTDDGSVMSNITVQPTEQIRTRIVANLLQASYELTRGSVYDASPACRGASLTTVATAATATTATTWSTSRSMSTTASSISTATSTSTLSKSENILRRYVDNEKISLVQGQTGLLDPAFRARRTQDFLAEEHSYVARLGEFMDAYIRPKGTMPKRAKATFFRGLPEMFKLHESTIEPSLYKWLGDTLAGKDPNCQKLCSQFLGLIDKHIAPLYTTYADLYVEHRHRVGDLLRTPIVEAASRAIAFDAAIIGGSSSACFDPSSDISNWLRTQNRSKALSLPGGAEAYMALPFERLYEYAVFFGQLAVMCEPAQLVARRLVALAGEVEQRKPVHIREQRTRDLMRLFKVPVELDGLGPYVCDATVAVLMRVRLEDAAPGSRANDVVVRLGSDRAPKSLVADMFDTSRPNAVDSRLRVIVYTRGIVIVDAHSGRGYYAGKTGSLLASGSAIDVDFPAFAKDAPYPVLRFMIPDRREWLLCSLRTYTGCTPDTGVSPANRDYFVAAINSGSIN